MPVTEIIDHPAIIDLPAAGFGILLRIILHYWQIQGRPLPTADHELMHIGRAHAPTWRHYKALILEIFEDIRPVLDAYRQNREIKSETLSNLRARRTSLEQKRGREGNPPPPLPVTIPRHEPQKAVQRQTAAGGAKRQARAERL